MSIRTKRNSKRMLAGLIAGSFALSGLAVSSSVAAEDSGEVAAEATTVESLRVGGADRYATSAQIAGLLCTAWSEDALLNRALRNPNKGGYSTSVIIASGENWPDGLAASGLSRYVGPAMPGTGPMTLPAPILLVKPDSIPAATAAAIKSIDETCGIDEFVIVGGQSAVGASVAGTLTATAPVIRLSGATRYETALAVANTIAALNPNFVGLNGQFGIEPASVFFGEAIVATGDNFADALSASTYAARFGVPVLLTPSGATSLPAGVTSFLQSTVTERVFVMGGNGVVPSAIQTQLSGIGVGSVRFGGDTRYDTSAQFAGWWLNAARILQNASNNPLAEFAARNAGGQILDIVLTTGEKFPDALSVGPAGATFRAPVLLTRPTELPEAAQSVLTSNRAWTEVIWVPGGTSAVSDDVVKLAVELSTIPATSVTNGAGLWGRQDIGFTQYSLASTGAATNPPLNVTSTGNPLSSGIMGLAWKASNATDDNLSNIGIQTWQPGGPTINTSPAPTPTMNVAVGTCGQYFMPQPTVLDPVSFIVRVEAPGSCTAATPATYTFNILAIIRDGTTLAQIQAAWNDTRSTTTPTQAWTAATGGLQNVESVSVPGGAARLVGELFQVQIVAPADNQVIQPLALTPNYMLLSSTNGASKLHTWTEFNRQIAEVNALFVNDALFPSAGQLWGGVGVCSRPSLIPNPVPNPLGPLFGTQLLGDEPLLLPNLGIATTGCSPTGGFGPGTAGLTDAADDTQWPWDVRTNAGRRQVLTTYAFGYNTLAWYSATPTEVVSPSRADALRFAWAFIGMSTTTNRPAAVFSPGAIEYCEPNCTPSPGVGNTPGININRDWVQAFLTRNDATVNAFAANPATNIDLFNFFLA